MNKIIMPKHIWDGKAVEKKKQELEKVPTPTGWRMVLFPLKLDSKTKSGLYLTDDTIQQSQVTTNIAKVLKMGSSCYKDKERYPDGPWCKKGTWVIFARYAGSRMKIDGGEVRLLNDDEVLATVENPEDIFHEI